jgi:hypothetical protein
METLIDGLTAARTVSDIVVNKTIPVSLTAYNLGAGESIELDVEYKDDGSYVNIFDQDEEQIALTSTKNFLFITAPGVYRIVKGITASAVTVVRND